jgi:hypothetical protein
MFNTSGHQGNDDEAAIAGYKWIAKAANVEESLKYCKNFCYDKESEEKGRLPKSEMHDPALGEPALK